MPLLADEKTREIEFDPNFPELGDNILDKIKPVA
jgi:hypothetical protein